MTRSTLWLSTVLATAFGTAGLAQAADAEAVLDSKLRAVAAILDAKLEKESVPGAAITIVSDQKQVWSHYYGVQDLQAQTPVAGDTAFSICSVSKLFTGIAIMNLEEAGRIDLDAPVSTYLNGGDQDESGATVANLLSHVSGLPREGTDFWFENDFPDDGTLAVDFMDRTDWYDPYDHWQYSNLGMAVLGQVIQDVSGQSFSDYVQSEILDPLGLENTYTDMPFEQVGNGFARGYYVRDAQGNRAPVEPHQFAAYAPAAGVASSADDLADFMSWHFRLRAADTAEVLEPDTLKQMQRVHWTGEDFDEPHWGLAYATRRYGNKTMWGHGGYCPGTVTEVVMRNSEKTGVAMMATANDVSAGQLVRMVYTIVGDDVKKVHGKSKEDEAAKEAEKPDADATDVSEKADLSEYEGHYARPNYDWDVYIGLSSDGLFALPLYDDRPDRDMDYFKQVEGDAFKAKRDDGTLGAPMRFIRNDAGEVIEVVNGGYRLLKQ